MPWHLLSVDAAAHEWDRLARWIDEVFVPWGEISRDQLPDCWALHRTMLTQLSWLHISHLHAYRPDSDPGLAADWHLRWAPAVLAKVRAARNTEMCRPGEHMVDQSESNRRRAQAFDPTQRGGGYEIRGGHGDGRGLQNVTPRYLTTFLHALPTPMVRDRPPRRAVPAKQTT